MNNLFKFYTLLILLSLKTTETSARAPKYAKRGCKDMCGTVRIPYPFGIGANCSINKWYAVDCNSATPYLSALHHLEILVVDLESQTVTVNTPMMSDCNQTNNLNLGRSPFFYSKIQNRFVFEGCGNAVMMDQGSSITGCSTTCGTNSTVSDANNNCLGISCCQATIPHHLQSYTVNLMGVESPRGDGACRSAFLVDKDSYFDGRFSRQEKNNSYVPISLLWTLSDSEFNERSCCWSSSKLEVDLGNGTSVDSLKCVYSVYSIMEGNVYLIDGCQFNSVTDKYCAQCSKRGGYCNYQPIYGVEGLVTKRNFTCYHPDFYQQRKTISLSVILGMLG